VRFSCQLELALSNVASEHQRSASVPSEANELDATPRNEERPDGLGLNPGSTDAETKTEDTEASPVATRQSSNATFQDAPLVPARVQSTDTLEVEVLKTPLTPDYHSAVEEATDMEEEHEFAKAEAMPEDTPAAKAVAIRARTSSEATTPQRHLEQDTPGPKSKKRIPNLDTKLVEEVVVVPKDVNGGVGKEAACESIGMTLANDGDSNAGLGASCSVTEEDVSVTMGE
jgi:hypothetical protein